MNALPLSLALITIVPDLEITTTLPAPTGPVVSPGGSVLGQRMNDGFHQLFGGSPLATFPGLEQSARENERTADQNRAVSAHNRAVAEQARLVAGNYAAQARASAERLEAVRAPRPMPVDELVVPAHGSPRVERIGLAAIPDPPESALAVPLMSPPGDFRDALVRVCTDLTKIAPKPARQATARQLGLFAVAQADDAFTQGESIEADEQHRLALGFLDVAVGLDPVSGVVRSAFELFVGRNLVTGEPLSGVERTLAAVGVLSVGSESVLVASLRGLKKLAARVAAIGRNTRPAVQAVSEAERLVDGSRLVWDAIRGVEEHWPGTLIPTGFELATSSGPVFVTRSGSKHLSEFVTGRVHILEPEALRLATQVHLTSLQSAVEIATSRGLVDGRLVTAERVNGAETHSWRI